MEQLEASLRELRGAVETGTRDHSLLRALQQNAQRLTLSEPMVDWYCRVLFGLYDLSNSPHLVEGVE